MKSIAKLLITTLVCSACLFLIAPNPPANAAFCICEPGGSTSEHNATANTCAKAKDKILTIVANEIGQNCAPGVSFCGLNFVTTVHCSTLPDGRKTVTGYYVYGCSICDDIPPNN